jgi:hypothetical protein
MITSKVFIIRINQSIKAKMVLIISFKIRETKSMDKNYHIKVEFLRIKIIGIITRDLTTMGLETMMDSRSLNKLSDGTIMFSIYKEVVIN